MAIVFNNGTLSNSTASTACFVTLSAGTAKWIYVSVYARTCGWFADSATASISTGVSTAGGLAFSTNINHVFQFQPGEAKYFVHVATANNPYSIVEVF